MLKSKIIFMKNKMTKLNLLVANINDDFIKEIVKKLETYAFVE